MRVAADRLIDFATGALSQVGVPAEEALLVSDSLVRSDLWGHQSHGVLRLPWYVNRIRSGAMSPVTLPETIGDVGAVAVIDGHDGVGQVLARHAAREAIVRAKAHGIGAVGVRNSNHFGTAAYFTRMAPPEGCVAILTTNSSPALAPWGGRERAVGSNPWSIAAPAGGGRTAVMDVSNSVVARGKIYLARQRKEAIPPGWAISTAGRPTTDPAEALAGTMLPMAEHKGFVISVMMDVLSGVLTGSGFGRAVAGPYQSDRPARVGHLYIAIDVAAFLPNETFEARMRDLLADLKATPLAEGFEEIYYPGEMEDRYEARGREYGIELPDQTRTDLSRMADQIGVTWEPANMGEV